jgi:hypothetical protein
MADVEVPYGESASDTATLLLAAAENLELAPGVVQTTSDGVFLVPEEVAKKAGLDTVDDEAEDKAPAKKAAAKKSAAKKA